MKDDVQLFYENALRLKLPVHYLSDINCLKISLGNKNYIFLPFYAPFNNFGGVNLAKNKFAVNTLLKKSGFPVPRALALNRFNYVKASLDTLVKDLQFPLVAKPMQGTCGGRGVVCNIPDLDKLSAYLEVHFQKYADIQIEEFQQGLQEYRVLILKNKVLGVVKRTPYTLVCDGKLSIEHLLQKHIQYNLITGRKPFQIDEDCLNCLYHQGYSLNDIPSEGTTLQLSYTVNRARGGLVYSLGKKIHPENARYLVQAAKLISLDFVGFDLLCEDIEKPFKSSKWVIIEANFGPDITLHECPDEGEPVAVSKKILRSLIYRHPWSYALHRLMSYRVDKSLAMEGIWTET
jgi:cyanophycin synthetase